MTSLFRKASLSKNILSKQFDTNFHVYLKSHLTQRVTSLTKRILTKTIKLQPSNKSMIFDHSVRYSLKSNSLKHMLSGSSRRNHDLHETNQTATSTRFIKHPLFMPSRCFHLSRNCQLQSDTKNARKNEETITAKFFNDANNYFNKIPLTYPVVFNRSHFVQPNKSDSTQANKLDSASIIDSVFDKLYELGRLYLIVAMLLAGFLTLADVTYGAYIRYLIDRNFIMYETKFNIVKSNYVNSDKNSNDKDELEKKQNQMYESDIGIIRAIFKIGENTSAIGENTSANTLHSVCAFGYYTASSLVIGLPTSISLAIMWPNIVYKLVMSDEKQANHLHNLIFVPGYYFIGLRERQLLVAKALEEEEKSSEQKCDV